MGETIVTIGGIAVLFGVFELFEIGEEKWPYKKVAAKIIGGAIAIGVGLLMKYFNV